MELSGPSCMLTSYATFYNLALRRRYAEAVARYRVLNNVSLKNTSLLALRIRLSAPSTNMTAGKCDAAASAQLQE